MLGAFDQYAGAVGQAGGGEGGRERMLRDRLRRGQRIRADAEHHRVAAAQHACRVGKYVGPAREYEADHAERRGQRLQGPAVVIEPLDDPAAGRRCVAPFQQAGDHVGAHLRRHGEPGRGPAARLGALDVSRVGDGDLRPDGIVLQAPGEFVEEVRNGRVADRSHPSERIGGAGDGGGGQRVCGARRPQELTRLQHHDQTVARLELGRQRLGDEGHLVAAKGDRHPRRQMLQPVAAHISAA